MNAINKFCPSCGKAFACQQAAGCWCETVHLDAAARLDLRARFTDCLCEECLRAAALPISGSGHNPQDLV